MSSMQMDRYSSIWGQTCKNIRIEEKKVPEEWVSRVKGMCENTVRQIKNFLQWSLYVELVRLYNLRKYFHKMNGPK